MEQGNMTLAVSQCPHPKACHSLDDDEHFCDDQASENEHDPIIPPMPLHRQQKVFLSADDRYALWKIQMAEQRPAVKSDRNQADDDDDMLPITDGCMLTEWKGDRSKQDILDWSSCQDLWHILHVGPGCTLLRRESQLPVLSPNSHALFRPWRDLQKRWMQVPSECTRLSKQESLALPHGQAPWFEVQNVPALLEGLADDWPAMHSWKWDALVERFSGDRQPDQSWRFSDTHGATLDSLETYHLYTSSLEGLTDESPLAIYDSQLEGGEAQSALWDDYTTPPCFAGRDLFARLFHCHRRPPYRWLLMGPARSGTGMHVDPLGTHAWVTLVEGCKRWILFPPSSHASLLKLQAKPPIPSVQWFARVWPQLPASVQETAVHVVQRPGETVYVPAGWPHVVLNVHHSVAITENYASEYPSLETFECALRDEEPELYEEWKQVSNG